MNKRWDIDLVEREGEAAFTVRWSPWGSMDKWVINRIVPSEAGLFQLWATEGRGLLLLTTELTFYGGLRNTLREVIDELAPSGQRLRRLMAKRECWFRFSTTSSREHLQLLKTWFGEPKGVQDSEKNDVLVHEIEVMEKFPLPPPDIKIVSRERMNDADFGPPLPNNPNRRLEK